MESSEEDNTSDSKLCTAFNQTKQRQKWLFSHPTFSDKLDVLISNFTLGAAREGSDGSYREELLMISAERIKESKCVTQCIQGGGTVPGKSEDHNSCRGELGGQLGAMCVIQIMVSILGNITVVVNSCDNISAFRLE